MGRFGRFILSAICFVALCGTPVTAHSPVVDSIALGNMQLPLNGNQQHRAYLGVVSEARVIVSQIRADHLIIAIFNSFCTICQTDAPILNSIYEMVAEDPLLKGKVKMIGIGAGNTELEVEQFQQTHRVPYPLFADPDFKLDKAITENLRAPMFVAVKNTGGAPLEVVRTHTGPLKSVGDLLKEALAQAFPDRSLPLGTRTYVANWTEELRSQ